MKRSKIKSNESVRILFLVCLVDAFEDMTPKKTLINVAKKSCVTKFWRNLDSTKIDPDAVINKSDSIEFLFSRIDLFEMSSLTGGRLKLQLFTVNWYLSARKLI